MNIIHLASFEVWASEQMNVIHFCMTDVKDTPAQIKKTEAILDAAKAHFAAYGFEATRLSEVAKDAGVAVGTIYLRYEGKAELLAGVLRRAEQSFADAMDVPEIWKTPFPERFGALVGAIFVAASKEENLAQLMALSAYATKAEEHSKSQVLGMIQAHLQDGVERSELRGDVDLALAARMAHGMVEGAMREMMVKPSRDPEPVIAQIADASARWLGNG